MAGSCDRRTLRIPSFPIPQLIHTIRLHFPWTIMPSPLRLAHLLSLANMLDRAIRRPHPWDVCSSAQTPVPMVLACAISVSGFVNRTRNITASARRLAAFVSCGQSAHIPSQHAANSAAFQSLELECIDQQSGGLRDLRGLLAVHHLARWKLKNNGASQVLSPVHQNGKIRTNSDCASLATIALASRMRLLTQRGSKYSQRIVIQDA